MTNYSSNINTSHLFLATLYTKYTQLFYFWLLFYSIAIDYHLQRFFSSLEMFKSNIWEPKVFAKFLWLLFTHKIGIGIKNKQNIIESMKMNSISFITRPNAAVPRTQNWKNMSLKMMTICFDRFKNVNNFGGGQYPLLFRMTWFGLFRLQIKNKNRTKTILTQKTYFVIVTRKR